MEIMDLSERKRKILSAIIENYIDTAEPVGSKALAQTTGLGVSSATIRNELAELEEMGLPEQPHTSAGSIHSSRGSRALAAYPSPRLPGLETEICRPPSFCMSPIAPA